MSNFKYGDRVRLIKVDDSDIRAGFDVGMVGRIVSNRDMSETSIVSFDNGMDRCLYKEQLDYVGDSLRHKHLVAGDKIRVVSVEQFDIDYEVNVGMIGELMEDGTSSLPNIRFDSCNEHILYHWQFEEWDDELEPDVKLSGIGAISKLWGDLQDIGVEDELILELMKELMK